MSKVYNFNYDYLKLLIDNKDKLYDNDLVILITYIEILLKEREDIRNYIIQSDLDKMLWGKELMKILDREE